MRAFTGLQLPIPTVLLCWPGIMAAMAVSNITIQNTSPELHYSPILCDSTPCPGGWFNMDLMGSSNGTVTSTTGPDDRAGNLPPQVFLTFRGLQLFVKTSTASNATANLTLSLSPSGQALSSVFQPTVDFWAFRGLDETQTITVSVTFVPQASETRLDIDFMKISVSDPSQSTSIFPTPTLSSTTSTGSSTSTSSGPFTTSSTSSSPSSTSNAFGGSNPTGAIIAVVLGVVIFVLAVIGGIFWVIRRRRRRQRDAEERELRIRSAAVSQLRSSRPRWNRWSTPTPSQSRSFSQINAEDGHSQ